MAGFYLGVGLCAMLFAQPLIYLALGARMGVHGFRAHHLDDVGPGRDPLQSGFGGDRGPARGGGRCSTGWDGSEPDARV